MRPASRCFGACVALLIVLSPAKRLDFTPPALDVPATSRRCADETAELSKVTKKLSRADLRRLQPDEATTQSLDEAEQAARAGAPLIVIYSRADCKFCRAIKRDYLEPMAADTKSGKRLVIREIGQDRDTPLTDFQGQPTTHAAFAAREKIKLVPVVAFYGPNGRKLAEPIVGARLPDFYQSYLDDAIDQASRQLKIP